MFAPFAPADPSCDADFVPTCEQAKGFGFCDGVSAVCGELCVAEVQAICPQTCKLSHDDTAGHTLWDDNAAPTDYDTRLPSDIAQTICNVCSQAQGTDLACCHNHPHDDGRRRLQSTTDASCRDAIWSPESAEHKEVLAYQRDLIKNLEAMSTPDSWWTAAYIRQGHDGLVLHMHQRHDPQDDGSLRKGAVVMRRPQKNAKGDAKHNQQFYFENASSQFFKIKVKSEGSVKCLDWSNPANPSDGNLTMLNCHGTGITNGDVRNQLWSFTGGSGRGEAGEASLKVKSNPELCLEYSEPDKYCTPAGCWQSRTASSFHLRPCHGGPNQLFYFGPRPVYTHEEKKEFKEVFKRIEKDWEKTYSIPSLKSRVSTNQESLVKILLNSYKTAYNAVISDQKVAQKMIQMRKAEVKAAKQAADQAAFDAFLNIALGVAFVPLGGAFASKFAKKLSENTIQIIRKGVEDLVKHYVKEGAKGAKDAWQAWDGRDSMDDVLEALRERVRLFIDDLGKEVPYLTEKEKYTLVIHYDHRSAGSSKEIKKTVNAFFDLYNRQVVGLGWQPHEFELDNSASQFPDDICDYDLTCRKEWHGIIKVKEPFDVTPRSNDFNSTEDLENFLSNPYLRYRFKAKGAGRARDNSCEFWRGWIPEGGTELRQHDSGNPTWVEEYYMGDVVPVDPSVWPGAPSPDGGHTPLADKEFFGMPPEDFSSSKRHGCGGNGVTEANYSDLFGKAPGMLCHEDGQCADPSRTERRIWPTQNKDDWKGHGGKCGCYSDHSDDYKHRYVCCERAT